MVNKIYATATKICFTGDLTGSSVVVKIYTASNEKTLLKIVETNIVDNYFEIDRFETGVDGIFYRYETELGGASFISEIVDNNINAEAFPNPGTKKGLQTGNPNLYEDLKFKHVSFNLSMSSLFKPVLDDTTELFEYNGYNYYIDKEYAFRISYCIRDFSFDGVVVYLILLATRTWEGQPIAKEFENIFIHPQCGVDQIVSPFNLTTDEGLRYYEAFCAYVAQKWMNDAENGHVRGLVIGNEVQSSFTISHEKDGLSCKDFADEYTRALRIAQLAGMRVFKNVRTYISLNHFWNSASTAEINKSYKGLELLNNIQDNAIANGNFYYCLAPHPYSEDLYNSEFWAETHIKADINSEYITFRNLEILSEYVNIEKNKYDGQVRRVILAEQGFASFDDAESEELQKEAFGRAYRKVMEIPEIDAFIYHSDYDWLDELINLGLMRCPDVPTTQDYRKPIYYLFKTIDQETNGKFKWEEFAEVKAD